MTKYIHWTIRRLLELHVLERRATASRKGHNVGGNGKESIDTLRAKIPMIMLTDYDRQRRQGKRSVAVVRHGVCSACHSVVSSHTLKALRAGILRGCDHCGRYLYLVEQVNEPSPAPMSAKVTRRVRKRSTATLAIK